MADSVPTILTENLSKQYAGSKTFALHNLNLRIMPGEVYGFLGPNGAGKSTTIRTLMNFIQPSGGKAQICGLDTIKDSLKIKSKIGYLAGEVELYPKMTGSEFLRYMSELQPPKHQSHQKELARLFDANLGKKIRDLSKGNKQKIGLIQAFMHEPEILILDEPTSGLDPLMQEVFFELVRNMKQQNSTIFVSSHNLSEVQRICDRVGFIRGGKLVSEQTLADLAREATQTFDIGFTDEAPLNELKRIPKAKVVKNSPRHVSVHMRGNLSALFAVLAEHQVGSINQREANLEQEFLRFYKGKNV
jgi:ABC-2 type transport system ATP-binding protein